MIDMNQWRRSIIASANVCAMPIMTYPALSLIRRSTTEMVTNPEVQAQCIQLLASRYPSAAALTVMDLSCEAEAFGSQVRFSEKEIPTIVGRIVTDLESAKALEIPEVGADRTSIYLKTASLATARINDRPVLAGTIGPFSLAGRLIDMNNIFLAVRKNPEMVHVVLEKCTEFLIEYLKEFKRRGANGVVIAEPAPGLLSPDLCTEFSSNYVKRMVDLLDDSSFAVILHNCGNTSKLIPSLLSTGVKALHLGNAVDLREILPQVPSDVLVFGNVEPAGIFHLGSETDIAQKVISLLQAMRPYSNFVLSSGCDIPPGSPISNLDAFFQTLELHNRERSADQNEGSGCAKSGRPILVGAN